MITKYLNFINESFNNYKDFILLIGPPGIGKSTYIKKLLKIPNKEYIVINRDDIAIQIAERENITYKETYSRPNKVFKKDRFFVPNQDDFYKENGKMYLKDYEHYGEIIDVPEGSYLSKICPNMFLNIFKINEEIERAVDEKIENAIKKKRNIIIDMVNNTKYGRMLFISKLCNNRNYYKVKAVIFNNGGKGLEDILIAINKKRDMILKSQNRDKNIPEETIRRFVKNYEPPTKDEGIDKIINVERKLN